MRGRTTLAALLSALLLPVPGSATLVAPLGDPAQEGARAAIPAALAPAVQALQKGDVETALKLARDFVKNTPGSAVGHEILGTAALAARQWAEAEQALMQAVRLDSTRVSAMVRLGQLGLEVKQPKKAEAWLRQAIKIAPRFAAAHRGLALALFRQGQAEDAFEAAQEAIQLSGGQDLEAKYLLAAMYHEVGRPAEAEPLLADVLSARSDLVQVLVLQGLVKLELRKLDEAEALLETVTERDPGSPWARLGLAVIERARGQLGPAQAELEKLARDKPDWETVHQQLAQTLLQAGRVDDALRAFDRAEQTSPNPSLARIRSAALLLALGHPELAIVKAKVALASAQVAPSARALLVQAYLATGQPDLAEQELRGAVTAAPRDPSAPLQLGRFYLSRNRPQDALAQFEEAARRRPGAAAPLMAQAQAHLALRQPTEALQIAQRVVQSQTDDPNAHLFLGSVQERLGRPVEAREAYEQALDRSPGHLAASRALARLLSREGRRGEATRLLEESARAHPAAAEPLIDLAILHETAGDTPRAIAAYRHALQRDGRNPIALNNLAYLLGQAPPTLVEALDLAERAYRRAPKIPAIADTLGWLLFQKGELERAEKLLAQAATGAPKNPRIRFHLGMTYAKQGKASEARRELEAALGAAEPFDEANEARRVLETLR